MLMSTTLCNTRNSQQKDRTLQLKNSLNSSMYDPVPPAQSQIDAFYLQLRKRNKDRDVAGPFKLRVHSSLERVYEQLKNRGALAYQAYQDSKENNDHSNYIKVHDGSIRDSLSIQDQRAYSKVVSSQMRSSTSLEQVSLDNQEGHKRRSSTAVAKGLRKQRYRNHKTQLDIQAMKPLNISQQSSHFKNSILPNMHGIKFHFKAANDLLLRNQGSLKHSEEEVETKYGDMFKRRHIILPSNLELEEMSSEHIKIEELTKEALIACNILRKKKADLQREQISKIIQESKNKAKHQIKQYQIRKPATRTYSGFVEV